MKQGRATTQEERIQIVKDCIASGKNCGEMALKYKVSYQQIRTWTLRFEELGEAGLEDRRGRRKNDQEPRTELEQAQIEIEQLKHKLYLSEMENTLLKKIGRDREERCLSQVRQGHIYKAIKECYLDEKYPIEVSCRLLHVARSAYNKWVSDKPSHRTAENKQLAVEIEKIHTTSPDKGYRRINDDLRHDQGIHINDKRVLRICRTEDIKPTIKYSNKGCTRSAKNPRYLAENLLDRQFHSSKPNEKWLIDATEFKWYEGLTVHKVYLSAILDLYNRRIVSFVIGDHNGKPLVFKTFDKAAKNNPDAHPLLHSDRGFRYTSRTFHHKLEKAGMTQSMSRVAQCIDKDSMEGFWGRLKREHYYGREFTGKQILIQTIESYISYYNTRRVQRNLGVLTPLEKFNLYLAA